MFHKIHTVDGMGMYKALKSIALGDGKICGVRVSNMFHDPSCKRSSPPFEVGFIVLLEKVAVSTKGSTKPHKHHGKTMPAFQCNTRPCLLGNISEQ